MGEAGPEARRGHHRRGARRRPALVVEFGEVGGEGLVVEPAAGEPGVEPAAGEPGVEPAAGEPGVEPAQSAGVRPARRVFGEMDAAARRRSVGGGRSSAAAAGRVGARESIFTTAGVRSTCRRLRRPGPRSG